MNLEFLPNSEQQVQVSPPLVLVVDDNEDNLQLLAQVLKLSECSFITATNGKTALFLAQTHRPSLILLDIMLPDMSGFEVVHCLKQNPQTSVIPIIAVTALARLQDRERLQAAGCDDYISKPYIIDDLEATISRYLGERYYF